MVKAYPYPYPSVPYPKPARVLKPVIITNYDERRNVAGGGGSEMVGVNVSTIHILNMGIEVGMLKRWLVAMKPVDQWVWLS